MKIEPEKAADGGGKLIPNPKLKLPEPFPEVRRFEHLIKLAETSCWHLPGGMPPLNRLKQWGTRAAPNRQAVARVQAVTARPR